MSEQQKWDKNMEIALSKYIRFPICEKCFNKLQANKNSMGNTFETTWNGGDPFISDEYYRDNWDTKFCLCCFIREKTKEV